MKLKDSQLLKKTQRRDHHWKWCYWEHIYTFLQVPVQDREWKYILKWLPLLSRLTIEFSLNYNISDFILPSILNHSDEREESETVITKILTKLYSLKKKTIQKNSLFNEFLTYKRRGAAAMVATNTYSMSTIQM